MSYAITLPTADERIWEVFCTHCRGELGTMRYIQIIRAIQAKGPILCPGCRQRHCDYCGRITKRRLPTTQGPYASGLFRICPLCVQGRKNLHFPLNEKFVTSHVPEYALNEVLIRVKEALGGDSSDDDGDCLSIVT